MGIVRDLKSKDKNIQVDDLWAFEQEETGSFNYSDIKPLEPKDPQQPNANVV